MRTASHLLLAALTIAAAAVAAIAPAFGSGPTKVPRDQVALERAAARSVKGIQRQSKRSMKVAQRAAQKRIGQFVKAARSVNGLAALGIDTIPGSTSIALNLTQGEHFLSMGLDALGTFEQEGIAILESAAAEIAADPDVVALQSSPGACSAWSEGGVLRSAVFALRSSYEGFASKLDRSAAAFVQANADTGNPVTLRRYPLPPSRGVQTSDALFGATGPLHVGCHSSGRIFGLFAQPDAPGAGAPSVVRLYSIDGTLYGEAEATLLTGTRTVRYLSFDFHLSDVPDGPGRLQLEADDGAGGGVPVFWDHVVIPGNGPGGGDDPDDVLEGCFFPSQQLAFANVANERTEYVHPVEAALSVSDTELLALTLRFGDDTDTPVGTLRFSIVEGLSGVTLDPDEEDGDNVVARIVPSTGVQPDVALDPNGGAATDAWFLDPGDEYEILICFSVDPRSAPAGPYVTKIRIVGRGRAGVLYAAPYRSLSFDFAYDGTVDLIKR